MVIMYGRVDIYIPYSQSLKHKRKIIKSIIDRARKRYNLSIAEVDGQDLWQRATLGFAVVTNTRAEMDRVLDALRETLDLHEEEAEVLALQYDYALVSEL